MDAVGVHAQATQALNQLIDPITGLGKHQHLLPALLAQQMAEQLRLALLVHRDDPLLDRAGGDVARADFDAQGIIQGLPGELADLVREGRREQQRLPTGRQGGIHGAQFFGKPQVEHAVGFVEYQSLQLIELHRILAEQIEQAPGCRHQQIDALAQLHHLRVDTHPAVHCVGTQGQVFGVLADVAVDLFGQLAGRYQDQSTYRVTGNLGPFQGQALQQRQGKACGLAGTGLGRGHQVTPGQHGRNGLGLDRRRGVVVQALKRAQQGFNQAEFGECHGSTVRGIQQWRQFTLFRQHLPDKPLPRSHALAAY
ncbi:hypothetical protein D3C79_589980 [compost metagenome]